MLKFKDLKKNLGNDVSGFHKIKLALLGDTSTPLIAQAIKGMGIEYAIDIELYEADFSQIDRQVFDRDSEMYRFTPEVVLIFESTHVLLQKFNKTYTSGRIDSHLDRINFAENIFSSIKQIVASLQNKNHSKIIFCNFTEEDDRIFGQFAGKVDEAFIRQIRRLNVLVEDLAKETGNLYICDLSFIQNTIGRERFWSPSIYTSTEMVVSVEALPYFAYSAVQIIRAFQGYFKKCLIVDLDNTLWGGIIGDDGIENIQIGQLGIGKAYTEFQYWIKKLQSRGIILSVCSKNTESIAKEPFEKHPDMVLKLSDIAVFIANWENKVDNIRKIQKVLNIGFDSMVFLDDNPFERNLVRENIPQITVPELPEDPALYLDYLYGLNLFETISYSNEDSQRTQQYQKEAERAVFQESFTNEDDFLKSLNMISEAKAFDKFTIPRVAQLSQRSNQFNLRTIRYTEEELERIALSGEYLTISFSLSDKFGDNGLISAVILKKQKNKTLFIESWIMSCRVLKRGMETFVLNAIIDLAINEEYKVLIGEYIPTEKNEIVENLYEDLRFNPAGNNLWTLEIDTYEREKTFIKKTII